MKQMKIKVRIKAINEVIKKIIEYLFFFYLFLTTFSQL